MNAVGCGFYVVFFKCVCLYKKETDVGVSWRLQTWPK